MDIGVLYLEGEAWERNEFCSKWKSRGHQKCNFRCVELKIPLDILCGDTEEELGSMTLDGAQGKGLGL